jgi:acyl-CoA synthetase (NDP forming)
MENLVEIFDLLKKEGLNIPEYAVVYKSKTALELGDKIGYPLVLKLSSIIHKTDIGGVITNVHNGLDLTNAWRELVENLEKHNIQYETSGGIMLQKQIKGVELIAGLKEDPVFGPVIMLGSGGTFVETMKDVVFRACPISFSDADEMINDIKAYTLLKGVRGAKPANLEALKETLFILSKLHKKHMIQELDINPLIVNEEGAFVADARIVTV